MILMMMKESLYMNNFKNMHAEHMEQVCKLRADVHQ